MLHRLLLAFLLLSAIEAMTLRMVFWKTGSDPIRSESATVAIAQFRIIGRSCSTYCQGPPLVSSSRRSSVAETPSCCHVRLDPPWNT